MAKGRQQTALKSWLPPGKSLIVLSKHPPPPSGHRRTSEGGGSGGVRRGRVETPPHHPSLLLPDFLSGTGRENVAT